jgi:2-polyprenyl-3-methyl-5-hydroxy-6-metoxy-1,4-benzoquinol methylase
MFEKIREKLAENATIFYINQHYTPYVDTFTKDKHSFIKNLASTEKGKVLDFGCGLGELAQFFTPKQYLGIDPNMNYIKWATKHNQGYTFTQFKTGKQDLTEKVDLIICSFVFHHIQNSELQSILWKFSQILNTNGKVIVMEAEPKAQQASKAVRFIMSNDVGHNYKDYVDWDIFFKENKWNPQLLLRKFGRYKVMVWTLEK